MDLDDKLYPHHCAPKDVDALVRWLERIQKLEPGAWEEINNTDWVVKCGCIARVIKYLRGDDWRLV